MKQLIKSIPVLLGILLLSCSTSTDEPNVSKNTIEVDAKTQWAISLANSEAERLFPPQTRNDVRIAKASGLKAICNEMSRGENDTLVYVVNYENNKGFALISATGNEQPVLAVIPNGSYDPEVGTENPGFNLFLDAVKYNAKSDTTNKYGFELNPGYPINLNGKYEKTEKTEVTHYGPALRITAWHKWGQEDIFGYYCPNGITGCVPLAITSIIAHLHAHRGLSSRVYYNYPGVDIEYEDIDWIEFMRHQCSEVTYKDGTQIEHVCWATDKEAVHRTIARVCRQIGYDAQATYGFNSTSVERHRAPGVLKKYLPDCTVSELTSFDSYKTMRCIDKGVMYMRGSLKSNERIGHAWFTDGYEFTRTKISRYEADKPAPGMNLHWVLVDEYYVEKSLNYMRWGWYGEYDGWYSGKELDPGNSGDPFINMQYVSVIEPED